MTMPRDFPTHFSQQRRRFVARLAAAGGLPLLTAQTHAADDGYPPVVPRKLQFARDHGAHPLFRTEWWYITGWLGEAMGFQLTFFRSRTRHTAENPSRFAPRQLMFAHAALALPNEGRLRHADRAGRSGTAGMAMSEQDTRLRMGNWSLERIAQPMELYRAQIHAGDFVLRFDAMCALAPILRGRQGLSRKGPREQHASYYYSRTHMQVDAELALAAPGARVIAGTPARKLKGMAWLDHEWSSSLLMQGASGWDWVGIHLADGGSLMAFRIRDAKGTTLHAHWDRRDAFGRSTGQGDDVAWTPKSAWRSPHSLYEYPIEMEIRIGAERTFRLKPLLADQEVDARASTGGFYWEGAVTLQEGDRQLGRGYMELTGYGEPLRL